MRIVLQRTAQGCRLLFAVFAIVGAAAKAAESEQLGGTLTKFRFPQYYEETSTNGEPRKLRSLVSGAGGRTVGGTGAIIDQAKVELFRPDGSLEFTAEASTAQFDATTRLVTSDGALRASTGDGRLSIAGRGFSFAQAEMLLLVSNDVRTTVVRATNAAPMQVNSDSLVYSMRTNRAEYLGHVRAEDAQLRLSTGRLIVGVKGTNAGLESLMAEGGVEVEDKIRKGLLRSESATYDSENERLYFDGGASWSYSGQTGRAAAVEVDLRRTNIVANGDVLLEIPRSSASEGSFRLPSVKAQPKRADAPVATAIPAPVIATGNRFETHGNVFQMSGSVRVRDGERQLTAETLRLINDPKDGLRELDATGGVTLSEGARTVSSEKLSYRAENGRLDFIGAPHWTLDAITGSAGSLSIDTTNEWITASTDVSLTITATNASIGILPGGKTNTPSGPRAIAVRSEQFSLRDRTAEFSRDVVARELPATNAAPRLITQQMIVELDASGRQIRGLRLPVPFEAERGIAGVTNGPTAFQRLTAREGRAELDPTTGAVVEMEANGNVRVQTPEGIGTGDRARYVGKDDTVTLTGNPVVTLPQATIRDAAALIWNPVRNSVRAVPPYTIQVPIDPKRTETIRQSPRQ